jgi:hypothetical protein
MKEVPDRAPDLLTFIWTGNMVMAAVRRQRTCLRVAGVKIGP